jgi:hypothetical protein
MFGKPTQTLLASTPPQAGKRCSGFILHIPGGQYRTLQIISNVVHMILCRAAGQEQIIGNIERMNDALDGSFVPNRHEAAPSKAAPLVIARA